MARRRLGRSERARTVKTQGGNDMAQKHKPKRGSRGYWPRKRIQSHRAHFNAWPERGADKPPRLQGFAGYKAGMTHAIVRDSNKNSLTADQEIQAPVTVLEVPPMRAVAVRFYVGSTYGLKTSTEIWAEKLEKHIERLLTIDAEAAKHAKDEKGDKGDKGEKGDKGDKEEKGKKKKHDDSLSKDVLDKFSKLNKAIIEDVRLLVHTQPHLITGVPKKVPDLMEVRIGGGTIDQRVEYAKGLLGKELKVDMFAEDGLMVDVAAVTKGHGFAGTIKKWHPKLLTHKNSKHRRMIGTLGPHFPSYVQRTVPQSGQFGLHQRTEFNKRILKIGDKGEDVTPAGGFLGYGIVRNGYVLIQGSVPGPSKRLIKLRDAMRNLGPVTEKTEVLYISKESKQGA
jgi:large subunit ribosomal protein L3